MTNHAFIFARGGSKGLPGKNIRPLAGKPLIQYSIDVALAAPSIDQVFVSTDDAEIAEVAEKGGAIVINRPEELANDTSPEWLSWRHAIEWVNEHHGEFKGFVSLPPTSPLRSIDDVEKAITKLVTQNADMCISVTPASRSPYFNMVKQTSSGMVELINKPMSNVTRRQDAPKTYDITTVAYVSTPDFVLNNFGIFSGNVTSIEVPKERAVDIDDIYDFMLAEIIMGINK
ncbi:acylneuraminate cytidylyltransferase [Salinivibrio kushneri]|uniref:acylneuraminate cytidylyltransferase family protein n=1 Tax=Salinivibrio kushneri TaxID=1908198 RepID=UPI000988F302|nr:acylneuraminate cytidylyltransferase family protein [Salinivibrio kushneri]OOE32062.1 acylneuraminate cytidylyltransferase [Salinivibrio kushneri]